METTLAESETGLMVKGYQGQPVAHPLLGEIRQSRQLRGQLLARIKVTPPAGKESSCRRRNRWPYIAMNSPASCTTTMKSRGFYEDDIVNLDVRDGEHRCTHRPVCVSDSVTQVMTSRSSS